MSSLVVVMVAATIVTIPDVPIIHSKCISGSSPSDIIIYPCCCALDPLVGLGCSRMLHVCHRRPGRSLSLPGKKVACSLVICFQVNVSGMYDGIRYLCDSSRSYMSNLGGIVSQPCARLSWEGWVLELDEKENVLDSIRRLRDNRLMGIEGNRDTKGQDIRARYDWKSDTRLRRGRKLSSKRGLGLRQTERLRMLVP